MPFTAAIVPAAGRGVRLGAERPKQFLDLDGRSILQATVQALAGSGRIDQIIVAVPVPYTHPPAGDRPWPDIAGLGFVAGGARRQDSVANAFAQTSPEANVILVHDAARPFVSTDVIARTIDAAETHGAAIAAIAVTDTVKQAGDTDRDGSRPIRGTLPRETIFLAQTPQAFRRDVLARALAEGSSVDATDEAMLVERLGLPVHIVEGDPANIKITTPEDLATAKAIAVRTSGEASERSESDGFSRRLMRIGTGYDLHTLVEGRPLILAGVRIPFERGLSGHSDADIVCHAVTDAVLGAASMGDIGRLFPDTDPKWKGADSIALLKGAMELVRHGGYRVSNVDVTEIGRAHV